MRSRDMPRSTSPASLTHHPSIRIPRGSPVLHCQSQNCPFQGVFGACMSILFELPKWSGNNFGKNHC